MAVFMPGANLVILKSRSDWSCSLLFLLFDFLIKDTVAAQLMSADVALEEIKRAHGIDLKKQFSKQLTDLDFKIYSLFGKFVKIR